MWKPYVKWESNLILLRLAAHLVDGQKLTRGLEIFLIGHKIRVCICLSSVEPHTFMPPVSPHGKRRWCCKTFPQFQQAVRNKPHTSRWKSCLQRSGSRSCGDGRGARPWQARQRQSRDFWQDTLCRHLVTSQWRLLHTETIPSPHEEAHWFCWRSLRSSTAKASTSKYGEGLYIFLKWGKALNLNENQVALPWDTQRGFNRTG